MSAGSRKRAPPERPPPERAKTPADRRAEGLFREHYAGVFAYLLNGIDSVEEARDIVALVFERALREEGAGLPPQRSRLRLIAIAREELARHAGQLRTAGQRRGSGPPGLLQDSLRSLSPQQRDLLSLRFDAGLSYVEIAELLGRTRAQVSADILGAVMRLRREVRSASRRRGQ